MMSDLSPDSVRRRLAMLSGLYRPMTLEEARALEAGERVPVDMRPEAVRERLDELSALWRMTVALSPDSSPIFVQPDDPRLPRSATEDDRAS